MRCEAAALRRDINEAKVYIDRLQRRYLKDVPTPRRTPDTNRPLSGHPHGEVTRKARIGRAL